MSDKETIAVYDQRSEDYANAFSKQTDDPRLDLFIDALPTGGHVLDLGCGPGKASAHMIRRGLSVDAVDASSGMVALAKERFGINVRQATFDQISGEALYDGIWAHFSLLHAPRAEFPAHLQRLHRALKPAGRFLIGLKLGQGEARDTIGRFYTYYSADEVEATLTNAGFTVIARDFGRGVGLSGSVDDWIIVTATA